MAEALFMIPEVIGLASKVAFSFSEYIRNVKDAPKIVRNITVEVKTLSGILETLELTLEDGSNPTASVGLPELLERCQLTLQEIEKLVEPEGYEDSDSESPRKVPNLHRSFNPRGDVKPASPFQYPQSSVGMSRVVPLHHGKVDPDYVRHPYPRQSFGGIQSAQMSTMAPSPKLTSTKRSAMSLKARIKWPIFQQHKAEELLRDLEKHKADLSLAIHADNAMSLKALDDSVKDIAADLDDGQKRQILAWLKPKVDMYETHSEQHDKQEDETCDWITKSKGWVQWLHGGSYEPGGYRRFIWIYGIPGAGKTVLASFLIDQAAVFCRATGFSYYYCHHERNHDETAHILRWIVGDLSRQIGRFIPKELDELSRSETFSIPGLMSCLLVLTRQFEQDGRRVYLVIDAVDESKKPRARILELLVKLGTDPSFENISLLITSREEPDICEAMHRLVDPNVTIHRDMLDDMEQIPDAYRPYTAITMSNADVMRAIQTYVTNQFERNKSFLHWDKPFRNKVEITLARNARGMFRWVACQIDILERIYMNKEQVEATLQNLPNTLFDTYARILESIDPGQHAFARTALALICSNTSNIKSANVLVQASLHNVQHGIMHLYDVDMLKRILGCLIKMTDLRRKPASIFRRDDDGVILKKASIAHYTVREFLFEKAKSEGGLRPAGNYALSENDIRILELQVVFNGLQQWGQNRLPNQRLPSPYEEYCLEMSDWALMGDRRNRIVKCPEVWDSVLPCLVPGKPHLKALSNAQLRKRFGKWRRLCAFDDLPNAPNQRRMRTETGILVSLILLRWPEFAQKYLKSPRFESLSPEVKHAIWTDEFTLDTSIDDSMPNTFSKGQPVTLLQLCVSWKRLDFLEYFISAGANFIKENNIIFLALKNPYGFDEENGDDGSTTGQLLKMILESGADPNPPGFKYTPLQCAVRHLEESWVQSLLIECREANLVGDPNGEHPYGARENKTWFKEHPLRICRTTKPQWQDSDGLEDQIEKSKKQVELLLMQYGAEEPPVVKTPPPRKTGIVVIDD
ncbi:hypothetical protein M426DRAFT_7740 [Hypoxylon sp. CI-4A]|nr:hypothetical protein M426DRAFT_7740 [Hypoxylon sp. CI-4A]